ncbi:class I SAM-dependent methyltransferase [Candidatus Saccharibacteria bacterium]|nr:class I SAM-dependent methyltransferase [Candidatus Saccharibacteria bacterium]
MAWKNDQVSEKETAKIIELASLCLDLEGDYVEMGCYKGDTSLILADILFSGPRRPRLYIYDSFEGLPEKTESDESALGVDFKKGELVITKREVKQRFLKAGLPVPVIKKAWFKDLKPEDLPEKIAFSFLDGDFYESIKDSLRLVAPKMASGGVLVVHDYSNPALPGVSKAVDEFVAGKKLDFKIVLL